MTAHAAAIRIPPFLLILLVAVSTVGPVTINIFIPSLPGLQSYFAVDYATIQLALTLYLVGVGVGQLAYGPLSDRFGRRPMLLAGLGIYVAGSALCIVAPDIETLIAGRVVQSLGGCAGLVMGRAIVRDIFDRERSASVLAYVTVGMVVAPMLSPTLGGFLDAWQGWRTSFAVLIAAGIALLALVALRLPETHAARGQIASLGGMARDFARLCAQRAFLGYALQVAVAFAVFFTFLAGAPYVMVEELRRPVHEFGPYFILIGGTYAVGNFIAGRISMRVGVDRMIAWGTLIALMGSLLFLGIALSGRLTPLLLFLPLTLLSIGQGFAIPNGLAGAVSVDPERAGAAAGLAGFLQMAFGALAAHVTGLVVPFGAWTLAVMMTVGSAAAVAFHFLSVAPKPRGG